MIQTLHEKEITLTTEQEYKYNIIQEVKNNQKTKQRAASLLNVSIRHINRLLIVLETEGCSGFIHKNTGKSPKNKKKKELEEQIIRLYKEKYYDSNFTHFTELLNEIERIKVSRTYVANTLSKALITSPKANRNTKKDMKKKIKELEKQRNIPSSQKENKINDIPSLSHSTIHPSRPRKKYFGELIQLDASEHKWFGNKKAYLHTAIDDSTGKIIGAYFDTQETLSAYYNIFHQILTNYGIPYEFFTDNRTIFNYKSSKSKDLSKDTFTQFGYACHQLGVKLTTSSIPQKKGRVERLFGTLQSRLPVELRLNNISTLEKANEYLTTYIQKYNKQFSIDNSNISKFELLEKNGPDINLILGINSFRVINSGYHIKYKNDLFIPINTLGNPIFFPIKTSVMMIEAFDNKLYASINDKIYATRKLEKHELESQEFDFPSSKKEPTPTKPRYVPPMSHYWKSRSYNQYLKKKGILDDSSCQKHP